MEEIQLTVTVHELDLVLKTLAEQPFKLVQGIIPKLVNQANSQPAKATVAEGAAVAGS